MVNESDPTLAPQMSENQAERPLRVFDAGACEGVSVGVTKAIDNSYLSLRVFINSAEYSWRFGKFGHQLVNGRRGPCTRCVDVATQQTKDPRRPAN